MAGLCYMAYTATCPQGSAPRACDCISYRALPCYMYYIHRYITTANSLWITLACGACSGSSQTMYAN